MGHIKEPAGIDFVVDSTALTAAGRKKISEVIAHYKATGRKMPLKQIPTANRLAKTSGKKKAVS